MEFKMTGLDEVMKKLDGVAKAASAPEAARRMRSLRCPVHGSAPTNIRVVGNEATAEFCCEKARALAIKDAEAAINRAVR